VLGSSESATAGQPAWIAGVREAIRRATEHDVPVFGICLGAQMLSQVLGGSVTSMPAPEIFWGDVEVRDPKMPRGPWLVWHYDAFTVPPGATELARSERGALAFRQGPHLGVQFHAEASPEGAAIWIDEERDRFAKWGLDPSGLRREAEEVRARAAVAATRLFDYWWRELVSR
jgi:GMP synthase (glutamine-hydrolysing)